MMWGLGEIELAQQPAFIERIKQVLNYVFNWPREGPFALHFLAKSAVAFFSATKDAIGSVPAAI